VAHCHPRNSSWAERPGGASNSCSSPGATPLVLAIARPQSPCRFDPLTTGRQVSHCSRHNRHLRGGKLSRPLWPDSLSRFTAVGHAQDAPPFFSLARPGKLASPPSDNAGGPPAARAPQRPQLAAVRAGGAPDGEPESHRPEEPDAMEDRARLRSGCDRQGGGSKRLPSSRCRRRSRLCRQGRRRPPLALARAAARPPVSHGPLS
jgi:hypothetical protein